MFVVGDTPTSHVKGCALATPSWLSSIRGPRLWQALIGTILRPHGAGTPKSVQLFGRRNVAGRIECVINSCAARTIRHTG